jgi:4-amino-4-deoxy-L-arabinose transferase-like glycosyltransferase
MFIFAILLGIYSYLLFSLGIFTVLYREAVIVVTFLFVAVSAFIFRKQIIHTVQIGLINLKSIWRNTFLLILFLLFCFQAVINLIGALGPELAFDALWYHLVFPKLYLSNHSIYHIPGGLLYYSDMPKLGELLYTGVMAFGSEINAKVLHWLFGLLIAVVIFTFVKKKYDSVVALLAALIFYSNLVVSWESTTAYIDLIRTFFEILALVAFVAWSEIYSRKWFVLTALMTGLAITTKLLSLGTLAIFTLLILYQLIRKNEKASEIIKNILVFVAIALLVPLPWMIFSSIHTGNPVYPFFTSTYAVSPSTPNPLQFFIDVWNILLFSPDPINPIYLLILPLVIAIIPRLDRSIKLIGIYSILSIVVWYFTPRTGGGRFLMSYLPAFTILCAALVEYLRRNQRSMFTVLVFIILLIALTTTGYRAIANSKYLPVLLGIQTKDAFLTSELNYSFGDFYDTDGYFKNTIKQTDTVLLYGFHNLYYVDFPFIHHSWAQNGDKFNYIAVQGGDLPERFREWKIIYENKKTNVRLYSDEGRVWNF